MSNYFPLILNIAGNIIEELPSGDNLDLTNSQVVNAGNITSVGTITAGFFVGNGSQLTGLPNSSAIANGTSNVWIPASGGNINLTVGGTANVLVATTTGVNIAGTLNTGTGNANVGNLGVTGTVIGNITGRVVNGTSNVWIPATNGNINLTVGGTANVLVTTSTGVNVAGTLNVTGNAQSGNLISTRFVPRVNNNGATLSGNITPTGDASDQYEILGLTGNITMLTPSGTPNSGQKLLLRFKDDGNARGITWTTTSGAYRAIGATLPTTTVAGKVSYVGCVYNSTDIYWDVIAVTTQA